MTPTYWHIRRCPETGTLHLCCSQPGAQVALHPPTPGQVLRLIQDAAEALRPEDINPPTQET